jgi:hypothetical protein
LSGEQILGSEREDKERGERERFLLYTFCFEEGEEHSVQQMLAISSSTSQQMTHRPYTNFGQICCKQGHEKVPLVVAD